MLYLHISRSDLSSAALKPKYLEDKPKILKLEKHSICQSIRKKIAKSRTEEMNLCNTWKQPWVFYTFFQKFRYWKFHKHLNGNSSQITLKTGLKPDHTYSILRRYGLDPINKGSSSCDLSSPPIRLPLQRSWK